MPEQRLQRTRAAYQCSFRKRLHDGTIAACTEQAVSSGRSHGWLCDYHYEAQQEPVGGWAHVAVDHDKEQTDFIIGQDRRVIDAWRR